MTTHIYFDKDKADEGLARLDVELMQRWQNSKFPLSDEGYKAMLESDKELIEVITPIGEESALYGCVGDESGCFDKEGV